METLDNITKQGYLVIKIGYAKEFHPHALELDRIVFYAKPLEADKNSEVNDQCTTQTVKE
jgi:hypothetical protein